MGEWTAGEQVEFKLGEGITRRRYPRQPAFDCPWHGLEVQAFCFRGADPELRSRWVWLTIETEPMTDDDVEAARRKFVQPEGM